MAKIFIAMGAFLGFLGVAAGAFGAHALEKHLSPRSLETFHTGARYHLLHAVMVVLIGLALHHFPSRTLEGSGWVMSAGIVVFSGSLYALALSGVRILGMITPIGGLALLTGWLLLGWGILKS